jgi:hypothetical protein
VQALDAGTVAIRTAVQIFIPMTVPGAAMQFRVIWEIDIDAEEPKEAAQQVRAIQLAPGMSATVFDVWAHAAGKIHRIDLVEELDRLDRDELFAVRAGLRFLQCNQETPPSVQELARMLPSSWIATTRYSKGWIADRRGSERPPETDSQYERPIGRC